MWVLYNQLLLRDEIEAADVSSGSILLKKLAEQASGHLRGGASTLGKGAIVDPGSI
jgi:hypothetical protein